MQGLCTCIARCIGTPSHTWHPPLPASQQCPVDCMHHLLHVPQHPATMVPRHPPRPGILRVLRVLHVHPTPPTDTAAWYPTNTSCTHVDSPFPMVAAVFHQVAHYAPACKRKAVSSRNARSRGGSVHQSPREYNTTNLLSPCQEQVPCHGKHRPDVGKASPCVCALRKSSKGMRNLVCQIANMEANTRKSEPLLSCRRHIPHRRGLWS